MSKNEKERIVNLIMDLLIQLTEDDNENNEVKKQAVACGPAEMLSIKECLDIINGLTVYSLRQLLAQGKIKSVRIGESKRAKFLVNKADLIAYFGGANQQSQE